ncbi:hypothetical protein [Shewanella ulleungensis]|uniref:hypothetical protein n=1 Tax=Shewanella ulleungensis TaxID=2282699 RepID=UPI003D7AE7BB
MKRENQTFIYAEPSWANSCVGDNGNPSYVQYAMGFSQATNLLIEQVLDDDIKYPVDDFIYPVCFNMRHSVELRLKGAITELQRLVKIVNKNLVFDLSGSHDIGRIWDFFKIESEKFDSRYQTINQNIEPTILDIADIDPTGQTFRYPINTESQKHLVEVGGISFVVLKERFNALESHLNTMIDFNNFLIQEYEQGSFTPKLSRVQLFKLARELPDYSEWRKEHFEHVKVDLKKSYCLSSNAFSDAINIIKAHYELAPILGLNIELRGINREELFKFLTYWHQYHDDAKKKTLAGATISSSGSIDIFSHILRTGKIEVTIWEDASKWITNDKLAGLQALFYFSKELCFSERYIVHYNNHLTSLLVGQQPKCLKQNFMDLLRKINCFRNILISLFFLQHDKLAKDLIEYFDWKDVFSWQERAETRDMFKLPTYSQYEIC